MAWIHLFTAALFEMGCAMGLKHSQGFTKLTISVAECVTAVGSLMLRKGGR